MRYLILLLLLIGILPTHVQAQTAYPPPGETPTLGSYPPPELEVTPSPPGSYPPPDQTQLPGTPPEPTRAIDITSTVISPSLTITSTLTTSTPYERTFPFATRFPPDPSSTPTAISGSTEDPSMPWILFGLLGMALLLAVVGLGYTLTWRKIT